jgi:hypothetical protein
MNKKIAVEEDLLVDLTFHNVSAAVRVSYVFSR